MDMSHVTLIFLRQRGGTSPLTQVKGTLETAALFLSFLRFSDVLCFGIISFSQQMQYIMNMSVTMYKSSFLPSLFDCIDSNERDVSKC